MATKKRHHLLSKRLYGDLVVDSISMILTYFMPSGKYASLQHARYNLPYQPDQPYQRLQDSYYWKYMFMRLRSFRMAPYASHTIPTNVWTNTSLLARLQFLNAPIQGLAEMTDIMHRTYQRGHLNSRALLPEWLPYLEVKAVSLVVVL